MLTLIIILELVILTVALVNLIGFIGWDTIEEMAEEARWFLRESPGWTILIGAAVMVALNVALLMVF